MPLLFKNPTRALGLTFPQSGIELCSSEYVLTLVNAVAITKYKTKQKKTQNKQTNKQKNNVTRSDQMDLKVLESLKFKFLKHG